MSVALPFHYIIRQVKSDVAYPHQPVRVTQTSGDRGRQETGQLPLTVLSVVRPAARQTDQSHAGIYTSANESAARGTMDQW